VRRDNGFLRVDGRIARANVVQEYRKADGTVSRELRIPEEVFAADSLASMAQLPVTNRHPPGMLNAKNARKYTVGSVGENVRQDGDYVAATMMITDEDAIDAAEHGRSQLSVGYTCELEPFDAASQDHAALAAKYGKFDSIMRNIRGNHVALVDVARAGPGASLRLDANDAMTLNYQSMANEEQKMHRFLMDGLTIEVADANAQAIIEKAISAQKDRADAAEKREAEKDKRITELTAKVDMLGAEAKDLKDAAAKKDAAKADEFKALLALGAEIASLGVDVSKLDHNELAYKTAAVKKLRPSVNVDGKGADYIAALYDLARSEEPSAADKARAGIGVEVKDAVDGSADAARRRYNERLFAVAK
jgi:hypothetical protein